MSFPIDYDTTMQRLMAGQPVEPYPPRTADELRLTAILERIERRLTAIEAVISTTSPK